MQGSHEELVALVRRHFAEVHPDCGVPDEESVQRAISRGRGIRATPIFLLYPKEDEERVDPEAVT
jgi:hypothetical protein